MTGLINAYTIPRRNAMYGLSPSEKENSRVFALQDEEEEGYYPTELERLKDSTGRAWTVAVLHQE